MQQGSKSWQQFPTSSPWAALGSNPPVHPAKGWEGVSRCDRGSPWFLPAMPAQPAQVAKCTKASLHKCWGPSSSPIASPAVTRSDGRALLNRKKKKKRNKKTTKAPSFQSLFRILSGVPHASCLLKQLFKQFGFAQATRFMSWISK